MSRLFVLRDPMYVTGRHADELCYYFHIGHLMYYVYISKAQYYIQGQPGCSCLDCSASCPAPPPRPPPAKPFSIGGADGYAVIMAIVFVIFSTLFLSGVFCCNQQENTVGT